MRHISAVFVLAVLTACNSPSARCANDLDGGCSGDGGITDGGITDGGIADGSIADGGIADGGIADGGITDGGITDGGVADGGAALVPFLRLNVGGSMVSGSNLWLADGPASRVNFSTSNFTTPPGPFAQNTADEQALLTTARWWDPSASQSASATIGGLLNGTYAVRFLVAEGVFAAPGKRVFGFAAQGTTLDSNIDPFALANGQQKVGVWREYRGIAVNDGGLSLSWPASIDNPELRALELAGPGFASGAPDAGPRFPRLAAVVIGSPQNYDSAIFRDMAIKHHLVVVSHWPGWQSGRSMTMAQVMSDVKTRSTIGTKLFIYVNNNEQMNPQTPNASYPVWQKLNAEHWWVYPSGSSGTPVVSSFGGGAFAICNNTDFGSLDAAGKNWIRWKADYDQAFNVVGDANNAPNPSVDGFFMDNVLWKPRSDDWNRDGVNDLQTNSTVQGWLRAGNKSYFDYIRSIWPGSVQLGNADWNDPSAIIGVLDQVLSGGMMEGMVGETWSIETYGSFNAMMAGYRQSMDAYRPPKLGIFNHSSWNAGDFKGMRYSFASALMDDGYYDINDTGGYNPTRILWFDEFNFDLGYPVQPRQAAAWSLGMWRRDFDNGIVLVNPRGNGPRTINLAGTFHRLSGTQDPFANSGATVTSITLADRDGIILAR